MSTGTRRRNRVKIGKPDEVRFDYAWKWFSFHAEQRTKMFNYMLLALGLLATAIVGSLNSKLPVAAATLSLAASLLAAVFFLIDTRNRSLYKVALDVLIQIESELLFTAMPAMPAGTATQLSDRAMAWRIQEDDSRTCKESRFREMLLGRHRFWMPIVILGFASLFAIVCGLLATATSQSLPTANDRGSTVFSCCTAVCNPCVVQPAASPPSAASSAASAESSRESALLFGAIGLVGLVLLALGIWRTPAGVGDTMGALCFAYGVAACVLAMLWFFAPASWRWAGVGSVVDQQTAACSLLVQCSGSDTPRRDPMVLRSERVGGFASGSAELLCANLPQSRAIESLREAIRNAYEQNQDALVLLVGATDREPLSAALRRRYESNAGLARARVEAVGDCLQLAKLIGPSGKLPEVVRVVSGPRFTPNSAPDHAVAAAEMAADREVEALVLGVPIRSAHVTRP